MINTRASGRARTHAHVRANMVFDRFPLYILLCQVYNGNEKVNGTRAHSVHTYTHMTQHLLIINYVYNFGDAGHLAFLQGPILRNQTILSVFNFHSVSLCSPIFLLSFFFIFLPLLSPSFSSASTLFLALLSFSLYLRFLLLFLLLLLLPSPLRYFFISDTLVSIHTFTPSSFFSLAITFDRFNIACRPLLIFSLILISFFFFFLY